MQNRILRFKGSAISSAASVVGKWEREGPLGEYFDLSDSTDKFGMNTWERAESEMQRLAFNTALAKLSVSEQAVDVLFAGDLLNQCVGSSYGLLDFDIPYFGLYGACSTAAEGIMLASMAVSAGYFKTAAAVTSSHYCSAERQYRSPVEYGAQRSPTAQWTVTGAGAFILANEGKVSSPRMITSIQGPWGNTIYDAPSEHVEAISPQNAYVMANLLKGVVSSGTGRKAQVLERPLGGKTGTTNDEMDAWFIGVTPYLVTATYVGYDVLQPMGRGETGSGAALPAYIYYAKEALQAYEPEDFVRPETGLVDVAMAERVVLPFFEGTDPYSGYGALDAMGGEDGGMDDVGSALSDLQGNTGTQAAPEAEAVPVPPEVLVRQKQAAERRKTEEQAKQGEDLLMEMF